MTNARNNKRIKKSSRFLKYLLAAYAMAIVWTSVAYEIKNPQTEAAISHSASHLTVMYAPHGSIRQYIQRAARQQGVDPRVAEWIVAHESDHHVQATGDGGESRGLWQINKEWHPEVSDVCAYDMSCSTEWSLKHIHDGYADEWSTWKYCRSKFENCPFKPQQTSSIERKSLNGGGQER